MNHLVITIHQNVIHFSYQSNDGFRYGNEPYNGTIQDAYAKIEYIKSIVEFQTIEFLWDSDCAGEEKESINKMREALALRDVETSEHDTLYDVFLFGCPGWENFTDQEVKEAYFEVFGEGEIEEELFRQTNAVDIEISEENP